MFRKHCSLLSLRCSAENQFKYAEVQLDQLVKLNPFNSTFHIWYSGHFGTINGLRLGRLPNVPVSRSHVGLICLLA